MATSDPSCIGDQEACAIWNGHMKQVENTIGVGILGVH